MKVVKLIVWIIVNMLDDQNFDLKYHYIYIYINNIHHKSSETYFFPYLSTNSVNASKVKGPSNVITYLVFELYHLNNGTSLIN